MFMVLMEVFIDVVKRALNSTYKNTKVFNLDYTIIQYGSLYGPRADATNGLRKIIESAINDEEITYQGDPEAIRSYIHVLDAADSSIKILDDVFKNETLILSGQQSMKVEDLLQMVAEILETSKPIKFLTKKVTVTTQEPHIHIKRILLRILSLIYI